MHIGQTIKHHRKALRISVRELARRLAVSDTAVLEWEAGRTAPNQRYLAPLAYQFGISADELLATLETVKPKAAKAEKTMPTSIYVAAMKAGMRVGK